MTTEETELDLIPATSIPFDVVGVELGYSNAEQVARWCGGEVSSATYKIAGGKSKLPCVKVPGSGTLKGEKITALIGQFVVKQNGTFRVFRAEMWKKKFVPVPKFPKIDRFLNDKPEDAEIGEGSAVRVITKIGGYHGLVGLVMSIDSEDIIRVAFVDIEEPGKFMRTDLELTNDKPN